MPKSIEFPKAAPQWVPGRLSVLFYALVDGTLVQCLLSIEAMWDHFGVKRPDAREAVQAFFGHRMDIEHAARRKIETGNFARNAEIILEPDDFPRQTGVTDSPWVKPLSVRVSPAIRQDPSLLNKLEQIGSALERDYVRMGARTVAEWDLIAGSAEQLIQLTLTDEETEASVLRLFTRDDLNRLPEEWYPLFRLWGDLLSVRGERLKQSHAVHAGIEE